MNIMSFSTEDGRRATVPPPLSNEIFGLIIESLGEDTPSLRSCSLVSSVFRHFSNPIIYRDIELYNKEGVETFLQLGRCSNSLIHTKSLSLTSPSFKHWRHLRGPHNILKIISQKVHLETLYLHHVQLQTEQLAASLLSKLSTLTMLVLQECCFGGLGDFVSFIRCFPRCQDLRLRCCTLAQGLSNRDRDLPTYDLAPAHLEITGASLVSRGRIFFDQGKIVRMSWLNLARLKSFKYVIQDEMMSALVLERIATCGLLEKVDMSVSIFAAQGGFALSQLALFIVRIKSLTLRCSSGLLPWWSSDSLDSQFPSSVTLERITIITPVASPLVEGCRVLDDTFSDTDRYPSLVELDVRSLWQAKKVGRKANDVYPRLCMDKYLPHLKALGRLPAK